MPPSRYCSRAIHPSPTVLRQYHFPECSQAIPAIGSQAIPRPLCSQAMPPSPYCSRAIPHSLTVLRQYLPPPPPRHTHNCSQAIPPHSLFSGNTSVTTVLRQYLPTRCSQAIHPSQLFSGNTSLRYCSRAIHHSLSVLRQYLHTPCSQAIHPSQLFSGNTSPHPEHPSQLFSGNAYLLQLFSGNTSLTTVLGQYLPTPCSQAIHPTQMFSGNTSLTTAPRQYLPTP